MWIFETLIYQENDNALQDKEQGSANTPKPAKEVPNPKEHEAPSVAIGGPTIPAEPILNTITTIQELKEDLNKVTLTTEEETIPSEYTSNHSLLDVHTNSGYTFRFVPLTNFSPQTTPDTIAIWDKKIATMITRQHSKYAYEWNLNKTTYPQMKQWLIGYMNNHQEWLEEYGISDYTTLSPRQAIILVSDIVKQCLEYDENQAKNHSTNGTSENDQKTIPELLQGGKGICRNYAEALCHVFNALKIMQNPSSSKLNNMYCRYATDADGDPNHSDATKTASQKNIIEHHGFNIFYLVGQKNIDEVIIDPTQNDTEGKLDHTKERYTFELETLAQNGIISEYQLVSYIKDTTMKHAETKSLWDTHLEAWEYNEAINFYTYTHTLEEIQSLLETHEKRKIDNEPWYKKWYHMIENTLKGFDIHKMLQAKIEDIAKNHKHHPNYTYIATKHYATIGDWAGVRHITSRLSSKSFGYEECISMRILANNSLGIHQDEKINKWISRAKKSTRITPKNT
jgi:hypothetical protein